MLAKHDEDRHADALLALDSALECRRLRERKPHPQPDADEHRTREERYAPAPGQKIGVAQACTQHEEDARRAEEPERRAELREHAVPALLAARRILGREQHGATPFAAEPDALAEPAQCEQRRRRQADRGVGRQQADRDRRQAHREQRRDERRLASQAVAEVAEQRRAQGAREEGQREGRERLERRRAGVARREEQLRKHQDGGRAVDVEIEELDRRADQARKQHAALGHGAGIISA